MESILTESGLKELEKASFYIQMLKQEGKLDEAAIPELLQMYAISHEEATALLASFKQTDDYKIGVSNILKDKSVLLVCLLIVGGFFLFAGFGDSDNVNLFSLYGILYLFAALGLIKYVFKLLQERFKNNGQLSWIPNKALPFVLTLGVAFVYMQYQFLNESYLLNTTKWRIEKNITLTSDCVEIITGGKHPDHYYEFTSANFVYPFRWYKSSHHYAFNKHLQPNIYLHKGDIITLFISDFKSHQHYITIDNVIKNGDIFLNIAERNALAKAESKNKIWFCLLFY